MEPKKPEPGDEKPKAIRPPSLPLSVGLGLGRDVVAEVPMPRPMVRLPFGWVPGMVRR